MLPKSRLTDPEAWSPLPPSDWNAERARHLLRRAGWSALPAQVAQAVSDGLAATLDRLFPATASAWATPPAVQALWDEARETLPGLNSRPPAERKKIRNEFRQRSRAVTQEMALEWMQRACDPAQAAFEKWVFCLSDVYVTSEQKVRNAMFLHQHQDILRGHALGPAPQLTKAVSRSPAMIMYLDLQGSRQQAPNENFARELFELFVLGEGNYTESDIKEAARAFVGYRQIQGRFAFARRQADPGRKSVFGQTGRFDGDAVIDLAYRQPAAATFLPGEMVRFYLIADGLPPEDLLPLATWWRAHDFELRPLLHRFFGSRAFYDPAFRGNYIKSPVQFTLGLCQDLDLDVLPVLRFTLNNLRGMGQSLFDPPNVRGWVGGRQWINSTTLTARRNATRLAIHGVPERILNADEQLALTAAAAAGLGPFSLSPAHYRQWAQGSPRASAIHLVERLLPHPVPSAGIDTLTDLLAGRRSAAMPAAFLVLLSLPDYNLC